MAPRIALSCAVLLTGTAAISAVVIALGLAARHAGPAIDGPIFHWTVTHQLSAWHRVMASLTKIGGAWETRAAAAAAAVCLIAGYRAQRWLPPAALGALIVGNHFLSPVIKHVVHRVPPPGAGGMFPSGGAERAVVFYGLIAYLLWRGFSGTRHGAIWAATGVAAVAFHEGYSRGYLAVHWFTDILGGWVYGALLLAVFIIAINVAAGPARKVPRLVQSQIQVRGPAIVPAEADLPL
jgi:membrane-associated phospholipid phosphatase